MRKEYESILNSFRKRIVDEADFELLYSALRTKREGRDAILGRYNAESVKAARTTFDRMDATLDVLVRRPDVAFLDFLLILREADDSEHAALAEAIAAAAGVRLPSDEVTDTSEPKGPGGAPQAATQPPPSGEARGPRLPQDGSPFWDRRQLGPAAPGVQDEHEYDYPRHCLAGLPVEVRRSQGPALPVIQPDYGSSAVARRPASASSPQGEQSYIKATWMPRPAHATDHTGAYDPRQPWLDQQGAAPSNGGEDRQPAWSPPPPPLETMPQRSPKSKSFKLPNFFGRRDK